MKTEKEETEIIKEINDNKDWTSWKCQCGCLNNRGNGNCGRCGFNRHYTDRHYGANGDIFINGERQTISPTK